MIDAILDPAELDAPVCETCGTQFPPDTAPTACPICNDERQYVGHDGQRWTTLRMLLDGGHSNRVADVEPRLFGIGTEPKFGIGQRALFVESDAGIVMWDCTTVVDEAAVEAVRARGTVAAIAISHPHYHSGMVSWSKALGDVPIYLHERVRKWVVRPDDRINFWSGPTHELVPGITLINTGGHFSGYQDLHWSAGADGAGVLLSGDLPNVCADRRWVSFMYSYPNQIPLGAAAVRRVVDALEPFAFERIYGAWWPSIVASDAKNAVRRSAERHIRMISRP